MKTVVIETFHNDYSGGGRYCLQLAYALSKYFDVYMTRFDSNDSVLTGMNFEVKPYHNDFVPDLFIAASHWGKIEPKGKLNACVCYFPLEQARESLRKYDLAISICDYADRYQKTMWGLPSVVINPYIRMDDFHIAEKDNLIICVGNYFYEEDGHSKNQHLVLKWFIDNGLFKDYELVFTGFIGNRKFYENLVRKAGQCPNVRVSSSVSFRELADLYSRAKYLVHAIGYGRKSPHQTEHFGYVAVEAMASGCQPIVHNSGGCKDIVGVRTWNDFEEILGRMIDFDPFRLRELSKKYSLESVLENQIRTLSSLVEGRTTLAQQQQGSRPRDTEAGNPSVPTMKLNIGCGNDYREGFVNLDNGNCRADVHHDMNVLPYPFEDGQFQYIFACHSLEHVDKDRWTSIVNELYRISCPGAIWEIMVPYALSDNYFTDPTHRMPFTTRSFDYFDRTKKLGELGGIYGLGSDLRVLESRLLENKPYGPDLYFKVMVVKESTRQSEKGQLAECSTYVIETNDYDATALCGRLSQGKEERMALASMHMDTASTKSFGGSAGSSDEGSARNCGGMGEMIISVSMITLNEERNIGRALASCSFADEIVVLDGGSADRTTEILGHDRRVVLVKRPWGGHFGEQRQASLERCSGDWVIRLDADEAFSAEFERGIRPFLESLPPDVAACTIRQCNLVGSELFYSKTLDAQETVPRIWRIRPDIRWEGHVHERPVGIVGKVASIDAYVVHYGFLDRNRYGEKGSFYSQIPQSGYGSREELLFREYDIQPRPPRSAVGKCVPPCVFEESRREPRLPRVAIVRGPNLNPWEMQNYEPLSESFEVTAYTTTTPHFDVGGVRLPVVRVPSHPDQPAYMIGLEYALFDEDLIYSADPASMFSYQASVIKEKFDKKFVCLQRENIPFACEESGEMKELKTVVRERVDHFVAVTERAKGALVLEGVDPERISVIPMGIDTDRFRPDELSREACRAELGIADDEKVVLFTGRMVWEKGVYDFVHAAKLVTVSAEGTRIRFVMVGKGPEREAVIARASEIGLTSSFIFRESQPYEQMHDLYNAADIFVLPSISTRMWKEQFGMVLVEAMACGTPVVSTTSGSIPEVVGDAGILVPANDPGELAVVISALCTDDALRGKLAAKGRARAVTEFDSKTVANRVADVFREVLQGGRWPREDRRVADAMAAGDLEAARTVVEEYLEAHSVDPEALLRHSEICSRLGRIEEAMTDLDTILLFEPERADARERKAALAIALLPKG